MKDPYEIIKERYITEKAAVLERLASSDSNRCMKRCDGPKYVFIVNRDANKVQIASALEEMYKEQKIKVTKVNTIVVKGKAKKRGRGRPGKTITFKKAIVTLEPKDSIDNV